MSNYLSKSILKYLEMKQYNILNLFYIIQEGKIGDGSRWRYN